MKEQESMQKNMPLCSRERKVCDYFHIRKILLAALSLNFENKTVKRIFLIFKQLRFFLSMAP
jgi:hypothetical protein